MNKKPGTELVLSAKFTAFERPINNHKIFNGLSFGTDGA
jgi:hypothetical protein